MKLLTDNLQPLYSPINIAITAVVAAAVEFMVIAAVVTVAVAVESVAGAISMAISISTFQK